MANRLDIIELCDSLAEDAKDSANPADVAPRPGSREELGLSEHLLADLIVKHLHAAGVLDLGQLCARLAVAGAVMEPLMDGLRAEAWVETRRPQEGSVGLRYALTDRGRAAALAALTRSGYVGPAPVPLAQYARVARAQSVHGCDVTEDSMHEAFADTVVAPQLLDQLGPALHSGRPLFIYGPAGTGKTFISGRLRRLLGGQVLIPYALAAEDVIVQVFDPLMHRRVARKAPSATEGFSLAQGHDMRFVTCERPMVVTGGELTLDMLELRFDEAHKLYHAPLQLKASNGMFLIDDLGRQRAPTVELLNRWIIPMEERRDFLNLGGGAQVEVPFDMVLVFSTNLNPHDIADEAFLRRLGYKIHFECISPAQYEQIWRQECEQKGIEFDASVLQYVLEELHAPAKVPLLPCHPRDLLGMALDLCRYQGRAAEPGIHELRYAWGNYFVETF